MLKKLFASRTFTFTMIAVMLLSSFAALITVVPNSPVGTASATEANDTVVGLCVGDSITVGYNIDPVSINDMQTYPAQLEYMIGGNVINAGVGGSSTWAMNTRLPNDIATNDPDNIYIMCGTNDLYSGNTSTQVINHLDTAIDLGAASGATVYIMTITPRDDCSAGFYENLTLVNAWILAQSAANIIPVDTHTPLEDSVNHNIPNIAYTVDGIHFNATGLGIIATTVVLASQDDGLNENVKFWDTATATTSSNASAWHDGVAPVTGDRVVFINYMGTGNCTWDTAITPATFIMSRYTGTITYTVTLSVGDDGFWTNDGKLDGTKYITCNGSFTKILAGIIPASAKINLTGTGNMFGWFSGLTLKITGHYTILTTLDKISSGFYMGPGSSLTINSGITLSLWGGAMTAGTFQGTVKGDGTLELITYNNQNLPTLANAVIECKLIFSCLSSTSNDPSIMKVTSNIESSNTITLASNHATKNFVLDMNGYDLTANSISFSARGGMYGGEGDITTSFWDSSAGTWTPETSNVHFTGTGTVKTVAGQTFYNLTVGASASVTQSSNVEVTNWMVLQGGSWDKNGYDLIAPMYSPTYSPITSMNEGEHYEFYPEFNSIVNMTVLSNNATWLIPDYDDFGMTGDTLACDSGTYVISLEFTNIIGTYWFNYTITVNNTLFGYFISVPVTDITAGQLYSYHPEVSCNGTYTLWLGGDNVLYASNITGNITGYPNAGLYSIILWMEDESGNIAYQNWTLTVLPLNSLWSNDDIVSFSFLVIVMGILTIFNFIGYIKNIFLIQGLSIALMIFVIPLIWNSEGPAIAVMLISIVGNLGITISGFFKES